MIAFVHRVFDPAGGSGTISVGTGYPQAIYAIFPLNGKEWLCKGGVMTYREMLDERGRTFTDYEWQESEDVLQPPAWIKGICPKPVRPTTMGDSEDDE